MTLVYHMSNDSTHHPVKKREAQNAQTSGNDKMGLLYQISKPVYKFIFTDKNLRRLGFPVLHSAAHTRIFTLSSSLIFNSWAESWQTEAQEIAVVLAVDSAAVAAVVIGEGADAAAAVHAAKLRRRSGYP